MFENLDSFVDIFELLKNMKVPILIVPSDSIKKTALDEALEKRMMNGDTLENILESMNSKIDGLMKRPYIVPSPSL